MEDGDEVALAALEAATARVEQIRAEITDLKDAHVSS